MNPEPLEQHRERTETDVTASPYDAILVVGFGGPEGPEEVMPFLENVTRGRNIPRERLLEVAEHYHHFGGVSPINAQVRELISALRGELDRRDIRLPIYWGNRNWHPMLPQTVREMTEAGIKHGLALVLAGYSSYSSCRQYREDVERARGEVGPEAPPIDKIRVFYNHPDFIAANIDRVATALSRIPSELRNSTRIAFTAHSIPASMAATCDYQRQLEETSRLIAEGLGLGPDRWSLVYQSRSGRPQDPWLEPDILDHLDDLHRQDVRSVVIHPVGFLSDHMEILFDLDEEARVRCEQLGMTMERSATVGIHERFISMLAELIEERLDDQTTSIGRSVGRFGPNHDVCPMDCCLPPPARPGQAPMGGRPSKA